VTEWIGAAEAAQRLGIKQASLYAYVSRGVLTRRRDGESRASMFDAAQVEELARKGRPRRPAIAGSAELVIETAVTEISDGTLRFRGLDATKLATTRSFEDVAMLLWTGALPETAGADTGSGGWQATADGLVAASAAQAALAAGTLPLERLQVIVPALAATDQFRLHLDRPAVVAAGKALIAGMAGALPPDGAEHRKVRAQGDGRAPAVPAPGGDSRAPAVPAPGDDSLTSAVPAPGGDSRAPAVPAPGGDPLASAVPAPGGDLRAPAVPAPGGDPLTSAVPAPGGGPRTSAGSIADTLASRLCAGPVPAGLIRVLNAALVLVADHELAASTLAARVAASMRADPYAVVATGLGAMGGALHGGAALGAELMLASADSPADAPRVVGRLLRRGERLPGFGHFVYKDGDPRANLVLSLIADYAPDSPHLAIASAVIADARRRALPEPNIEFALALLAGVAQMIRGSGEAIFAVGRASGWLAHALEEYERNIPIRPRAVYVGPAALD
jgi:citrate synthase